MFTRIARRYKYFRFTQKWKGVTQPWRDKKYLTDLKTLLDTFSDTELSEMYNEHVRISSGYARITEWLATCASVREAIMKNRYRPGPNAVFTTVTLGEYLITEDDYLVGFVSGVYTTIEEMIRLQGVIDSIPKEVSRDYYYNQLSELFNTGDAFVSAVVMGGFN